MTASTVDLIYEHYTKKINSTPPRDYIGWSAIGASCERAIYYDFRWATRRRFDGRIARLFQTGHLEEARVIGELRQLPGVQVFDSPKGGGQYAVPPMANGHLRGHLDCVVKNLPEYPGEAVLCDVKTANTKRFDRVVENGMAVESPQYVAQAMGYMGLMNLKRAVYLYVCKDDDRLHAEWLEFDQTLFDQLVAKAERIIASDNPPLQVSYDPTDFVCRFCDHKALCWDEMVAAEVNCRTCKHAEPVTDGAWRCNLTNSNIPVSKQRLGCDEHLYLPSMISFATYMDGDEDWTLYNHDHKGITFLNKPKSHAVTAGMYTSKEINLYPGLLCDPAIDDLREEFDGELIDA